MAIQNPVGKHAISVAEKIASDAKKRTIYKLSCMDDKEFKSFVIRAIECGEIVFLGDVFGIEEQIAKNALQKV